ncbi:MAG TPA: hypothetical protein VFZ43_04350 [Anaerolineales bacterium]
MNSKLISDILQPDDPAYERCCQRLKEDLELDDEAVEVILHLRNQVTVLQTRLRRLESTLEIYETSYGSRLTKYREVSYEADWEDI